MHEAFRTVANDSRREALDVYRAAWRRGLTTPEMDALAVGGSSIGERHQHAVSQEPLALEMDESKRGYLHALPGSEAARIGAGLFMKPIG